MPDFPFFVEPLGKYHDRNAFSCGNEALDRYLHAQAMQDVKRKLSQSFALLEMQQAKVIGYYCLSAASVRAEEMPEGLRQKLPRYPLPAALIGRLAVDSAWQGKGIGKLLLADAVKRVGKASESIAVHVMLVDAKNDSAKDFYRHFGFQQLTSHPLKLYLPLVK